MKKDYQLQICTRAAKSELAKQSQIYNLKSTAPDGNEKPF